MSLAWVHVTFITLATAVLVWFGFWGLDGYAAGRGFGDALLGGGALLSSAALGWYAWVFVRKVRRQHL